MSRFKPQQHCFMIKRWLSNRVESMVSNVIDKIRSGDIEIDKEKYAKNRAARMQAGEASKAAERRARKVVEKQRKQMMEDMENEVVQKARLSEQYQKIQEAREEGMRRRREQREEEKRKHKAALRKAKGLLTRVKKEVPLYKRLEQRYQEKHVLPQIEQRNKKLRQRSERMAPMDIQSLVENERRVKEFSERSRERSQSEARSTVAEREVALKAHYRGRAHRFVSEEDTQMRKARKKEEHVKQMIERKRRYGKLIKEMFAPSIDQTKKDEILGRLEREKERERFMQKTEESRYRAKHDLQNRAWRIEDEQILELERERVRRKRRKEREEAKRAEDRAASAPDFLAYAVKKGRKKKKKVRPKENIKDIERKIIEMEKIAQERAKELRKRGDPAAAEEESELYIRLAQEKMKLLDRVRNGSR
mmetsp:Transcript_12900/g.26360  ORF Transcript_12900/g.26360 Transcript_12900/m.26360 type:complete len:420 (-) Transcript_12900:303-1562(-)